MTVLEPDVVKEWSNILCRVSAQYPYDLSHEDQSCLCSRNEDPLTQCGPETRCCF